MISISSSSLPAEPGDGDPMPDAMSSDSEDNSGAQAALLPRHLFTSKTSNALRKEKRKQSGSKLWPCYSERSK